MTSINSAGPSVSSRPEPLPSYLAATMNSIERKFSATGTADDAAEQVRSGKSANFGPQNKGKNVDTEG